MGHYLIDTNIISHYFSETLAENIMTFLDNVIAESPNISIITSIELLSWVSPYKEKEAQGRAFVAVANVIELTAGVAKECVKIRRGLKIKMPDAIIAATAIEMNLTLITRDKGFKGISGLKLLELGEI